MAWTMVPRKSPSTCILPPYVHVASGRQTLTVFSRWAARSVSLLWDHYQAFKDSDLRDQEGLDAMKVPALRASPLPIKEPYALPPSSGSARLPRPAVSHN